MSKTPKPKIGPKTNIRPSGPHVSKLSKRTRKVEYEEVDDYCQEASPCPYCQGVSDVGEE